MPNIRLVAALLSGLPLLAHSSASAPATAQISYAGSMIQVIFALGLVLALIIAAAWLVRRFSLLPRAAGGQLRVVSGLMVGQRERVVIVEVRDQWLVLGVTSQHVNLLSMLQKPADAQAAQADLPPFADWLSRALQKRTGNQPAAPEQT